VVVYSIQSTNFILMTSLKVDQKFQAPPRENFWLRHWSLMPLIV